MKMKYVNTAIGLIITIATQACLANDFVASSTPTISSLAEQLTAARNLSCRWMAQQELTSIRQEDFKSLCGVQAVILDQTKFSFPRLINSTALIQNIRNLEVGIVKISNENSEVHTLIQLNNIYEKLDFVMIYVIATSSSISVDRNQVDAVNQVFSASYDQK